MHNVPKAFYSECAVSVEGGYLHPEKGFCVEIYSEGIPRRSLSFWELIFASEEGAATTMLRVFGFSLEQAQAMDRRKELDTRIKVRDK